MTKVFEYYAGVDGGGTHCRVRVRDAGGQLVGEATGGPGNIRLGFEVIWPNILTALDEALAQGGRDRAVLPQMSFGLGLAGITNAETAQQTIAAGPDFGRIRATSDAHAALLGAFSGRDGAILITGTGSAAYGWVKGKALVAGGWGFEVSDDGSGASLGRESIRAALHAHDGLRDQTAFTRAVMDHFDGDPSVVVAWVTTARAGDYGTLAPLAISHAEQGDAVAVELVQAQAAFLERYIHRLRALGAQKVALVGGMAKPFGPWLSATVKDWLAEPEQDALEGSILMARGAPDGFSLGSEAGTDMRVVG
jgi:glucosamine kinase